MKSKNITINANGGIVSIANEGSTMTVNQYNYNNGLSGKELDTIIKGIMDHLSGLKKEEADKIVEVVEMAKEELTKPESEVSKLRKYLTILAPMVTVTNGIPALAGNLQKLADYITSYIR